jgi:prolyl 4-hydroxylase
VIPINFTSGSTKFPRLKALEEGKWCEWVDYDQELGAGVWNAIFWRNFDREGRGLKSTLHVGLPVIEGMKTGLNIWTWVKYDKAGDMKFEL